MKTLYLDCGMGAAGDMLTAALLELIPDPDSFLAELNTLAIPNVQFIRERSIKCGITGTHISVSVNGMIEGEDSHEHIHSHDHEHMHSHDHEHMHSHDHGHTHSHDHHHRSMSEIEEIISKLSVSQKIKNDILAVYCLIAEAESHAHNKAVTEIHFHEVGTMDAIADITAVCILIDKLSPDEIVVSPIHVGSGEVRCAHGILPVPAPATAFILKDIPIYGGKIRGELCTPTGAALLKYFATRFGDMPLMKPTAIGYGMGRRDFEKVNCVRAILGESVDEENKQEMACELSCNVDDMTGEEIAFAMERLFDGGALEVYTIPIGMKKSRPGVLLRVICAESRRSEILRLIFRYTSTIGIREIMTRRYILKRDTEIQITSHGEVRMKHSSGYGVMRDKIEYDDLSRIAIEKNITLQEARKLLEDE